MKKVLLTIFLLSLHISIISAQEIPGYLGKRWTIQYEGHFFPSFYNPNKAEVNYTTTSDYIDIKTSINYQHHLATHYVTSKKSAFGVDLVYLSTYANAAFANNLSYDNDYSFSKHLHTSAFSIALSWKAFTDHFAPLGKYWELKAGIVNYQVGDFSYIYSGESMPPMEYHIPGSGGICPFIGLGYGVQRVIKDKFLVSGGIDLNFIAGDLGFRQGIIESDVTYSLTEYVENGDLQTSQEILRGYGTSRLFMHYLVNFKLGIGILL